jgi:hypothetical protein
MILRRAWAALRGRWLRRRAARAAVRERELDYAAYNEEQQRGGN